MKSELRKWSVSSVSVADMNSQRGLLERRCSKYSATKRRQGFPRSELTISDEIEGAGFSEEVNLHI